MWYEYVDLPLNTVNQAFKGFRRGDQGKLLNLDASHKHVSSVLLACWAQNCSPKGNFGHPKICQERIMTSLFFHGGGGRACDFVLSRCESRIFRVY